MTIETLGYFIKLYHDTKLKVPTRLTTTIVFLFVGILGGFILAFLQGSFASYKIVDLYLKSVEIRPLHFIGINTAIPPPASLITIWRLLILVYGIVFYSWKNKITIPPRISEGISTDN